MQHIGSMKGRNYFRHEYSLDMVRRHAIDGLTRMGVQQFE